MSDSQPTWKVKAKRYLAGAVVIALFIWAFSVAQGARSTAAENAERLTTPELQMSFVPGGPERFGDPYGDVENVNTEEEVSEADFRWATLMLENTAYGAATDVQVTLRTTAPVDHVLVSPPGFGNEVSVEAGEEPNNTVVTLDELPADDTTYFFLGVSPDELPADVYAADPRGWVANYEQLLESVQVDGEDFDHTLYGEGYTATAAAAESS